MCKAVLLNYVMIICYIGNYLLTQCIELANHLNFISQNMLIFSLFVMSVKEQKKNMWPKCLPNQGRWDLPQHLDLINQGWGVPLHMHWLKSYYLGNKMKYCYLFHKISNLGRSVYKVSNILISIKHNFNIPNRKKGSKVGREKCKRTRVRNYALFEWGNFSSFNFWWLTKRSGT